MFRKYFILVGIFSLLAANAFAISAYFNHPANNTKVLAPSLPISLYSNPAVSDATYWVNCSIYLKMPSDVNYTLVGRNSGSGSFGWTVYLNVSEYGVSTYYEKCRNATGDEVVESGIYNINVSNSADGQNPNVTLSATYSPANGSVNYTATLPFTTRLVGNYDDNSKTWLNCTVFLKSPSNATFYSVYNQFGAYVPGYVSYYYPASEFGKYYWYMNCTDLSGNTGSSATWEFSLVGVKINRITPVLNLTWTRKTRESVRFTMDGVAARAGTCEYYRNGAYVSNVTVKAGTNTYRAPLVPGRNNYTMLCYEKLNRDNWDNETFAFISDKGKPVITANASGTVAANATTINVTVVDDYSEEINCTVKGGGEVQAAEIANGDTETFTVNLSRVGSNSFTITCTDEAGNKARKTVRIRRTA